MLTVKPKIELVTATTPMVAWAAANLGFVVGNPVPKP